MTLEEHRKLGIAYFNTTWDLLDKQNRNKEDNLKMIHFAHASRLHWQLSGCNALHLARGDWQVSRVYSVLEMGESALVHAHACYNRTIKNKITDFDLVFAYECLAFAYKILGKTDHMNHNLNLAYKAIDQVKLKEDKTYCKNELDKIKNSVL